jgi:hypothetical protein
MANTCRLQVDILEHQLDELEELQRLGGLRSKRELWDTAFTLLKWATRKRSEGFSIGSITEEGSFTELEMPFLEHYARSTHRESQSSRANGRSSEPTTKVANPARAVATQRPQSRTSRRNGAALTLAKKSRTA